MKAPVSAGHVAVALLSLTPVVAGLSWPRWLPDLDTLVVRQEDNSDSPSPTPTPTGGADNNDEDSESTSSRRPMTPITTNLNTGGITQTGTETARPTGNGTRTDPPRRTTFNPQDPAAGVVMVTPAVTDGYQLYKFGDFVTWGWNYTNLLGTPTAVDVLIRNSNVPQPWTLTQNMSFEEVGSFTWDTNEYTNRPEVVRTPLLTDQYTLVIHDSDGGPSDAPEPGYLAPFSGFIFGLYEGQPYEDTNDGWQCASCSGAMGGMDDRAVGAAVVMSALTVLSFTWFVAGFGASL
ncbi:hypothetical protein MMYC01_204314 [Madurella mycetomatis]|uniref:DUF7137 domain-containing protein n=1 Tax=Madurella mycetomatis TaxID=100816 RepID=A0A175W5L8_9PEZI|nr:hypothetical protein MMYC01_204314 [Madurella mycetomatis]